MFVDVSIALARSFSTLLRPRVWLYIMGPALISFGLWVMLAMWELDLAVSWLVEQPPLSWLTAAGVFWLAKFFAVTIVWLGILSLAYVSALMITAIFFLPMIIDFLAERDYPDIARMGKDSFVKSATNSVMAALLFVVGWVLTLPFWLIPGMGLILPVFWLAWLNRRTFAFDTLSVHAGAWESQSLREKHGLAYLLLGVILALMAYVPVLGLFVPSLAAIAYVHYSLERLRQFRGGEVVVLTAEQDA